MESLINFDESIRPEKNVIFDSTILNAVQLCAMRYYLEFELHLRTPNVPEPMEEGDLLHRMEEVFYTKFAAAPQSFQDNFESIVDEAIAHGEQHSLELQLAPAEVQETIYQFQESAKHYRMDGIIPLEVERPFLLALYQSEQLGVYYAGKIDLIALTPEYGKAVIDHKTMRRNREPLSLSNQFTGYAMAADTEFVLVNKIGFQKTLKPHERFRRYPLHYTTNMKDRWKENTIWWGKQLAFFMEHETWPENRTSCDKYSGCLYIPVCSAQTEEARQWAMKSQFIIGSEWDPSAVLRGVKA